MQIVINISDDMYKDIRFGNWNYFKDQELYKKYLGEVIVDGTPLPKEHGRLVDGDAIISSHKSGYWHLHNVIKNASTIIEADKENI